MRLTNKRTVFEVKHQGNYYRRSHLIFQDKVLWEKRITTSHGDVGWRVLDDAKHTVLETTFQEQAVESDVQ